MITNIPTLLEILSSIRNEWVYVDSIITKIKSGSLQNEDIASISNLITESLGSAKDTTIQRKMRDILFQISLIHLEEGEIKKHDILEANETITHL